MQSSKNTGTSTEQTLDFLVNLSPWLWAVAIALFGVGDLLTTAIGLSMGWAVETGPVAAAVVAEYGLVAMVPLKVATFALCYGLWTVVGDPTRVGIPIGLAALGALVTANNVVVLYIAAV